LLVTSAFTTDWNDLPLRSVFLPLCQELAKYAMGFQGAGGGLTVGEDVPIARLSANLARTVERATSRTPAFSQAWKVVAPSGADIALTEADLTRSPFLTVDQPGFYTTTVRNVEDSLAVNLAPLESDLGKLEAASLLASIKRTPASAPASESSARLPLEERQAWEARQGVWRFLALLALIILLAETLLSNRYKDAGEGGV